MESSICLVRHGVTEWNYAGRVQGRSDIPLAPEGERQAALVAQRLAGEPWDAIWSSPLKRACQTAQAIAGRVGAGPVRIDHRLAERQMGAAEGMLDIDLPVLWPGVPWDGLPGMEPVGQLAARAHEALRAIAALHPGGRVVCVAHGSLIGAFLRSLEPPTPLQTHPRTVSITLVRHDGTRFTQESAPDHRHILLDGVEYSGEKGRLSVAELEGILPVQGPAGTSLEGVIWSATAIETARVDDRLVGFARAFTDGVLAGFIDLAVALPGHEQVRPVLVQRLMRRYPKVTFTLLADGGDHF